MWLDWNAVANLVALDSGKPFVDGSMLTELAHVL
jgi:hypothetical protein